MKEQFLSWPVINFAPMNLWNAPAVGYATLRASAPIVRTTHKTVKQDVKIDIIAQLNRR